MEHPLTPENQQAMQDIMQHTIYLMGFSFILGSVFTVIMLWVLDFVRRNKPEGSE
jgi:hypothetical protein